MTSRLIDRLALVAKALIFCGALVVLWRGFAGVSPCAVFVRLAAMPPHQTPAAVTLTAANYLYLSNHGSIAVRYVRRQLR